MDGLSIDFKYSSYTNKGEPNLNWAIRTYFMDICKEHRVNLDNQMLYISDYNNTICPVIKPNIPIKEYDESKVMELFNAIRASRPIAEKTIDTRHSHLVLDPIEWYFKEHGKEDDPMWGAFFKFDDKGLGIEVALKRVQRSFTDKEAFLLAKELLGSPITMPGENFGIAICEYIGARINEAAGASFRDIIQLIDYPNEYVLRIGALTTKLHSNLLKASGKTYNAPRLVPIMDIFAERLLARMKYLEDAIRFPCSYKNIIYNSVLDLPIACHGQDYLRRCSSDEISNAARSLFKDVLHFDENRMAGLSELMFRDPERFDEEKSATCYTCRRDFATELSIALHGHKHEMVYQQYNMGHKIDDSRFKRNDLTDEYYLHETKALLEKSHRVNSFDITAPTLA